MSAPPFISNAVIALRQCGESAGQIARRTGAEYPTVNNWLKGHRKPGPAWKAVMVKFYGIPEGAWFEPAVQDPGVSTIPGQGGLLDKLHFVAPVAQPERAPDCTGEVPSSSLGGGSIDPRSEAEALAAHVRQFRWQVENDQMLTANEKAKTLELASRAVERLYRLTGEAANIPVTRILVSPAWQKIKDTITAALEVYPEALRAAVIALEGLT